ncbi:hypothetical protein OBBRIDRAFT_272370 [Obba rivulosa]|uniref:Uncharacterized protein n=1 Tax=Obba rivulosa TaxID=1052685 RepID=A0A8E2APC6_9APHY|nr:hypothetical protein OBBRIDRAFT_272370 [Obba rivulosa]
MLFAADITACNRDRAADEDNAPLMWENKCILKQVYETSYPSQLQEIIEAICWSRILAKRGLVPAGAAVDQGNAGASAKPLGAKLASRSSRNGRWGERSPSAKTSAQNAPPRAARSLALLFEFRLCPSSFTIIASALKSRLPAPRDAHLSQIALPTGATHQTMWHVAHLTSHPPGPARSPSSLVMAQWPVCFLPWRRPRS